LHRFPAKRFRGNKGEALNARRVPKGEQLGNQAAKRHSDQMRPAQAVSTEDSDYIVS
jgi:hypothetical protein